MPSANMAALHIIHERLTTVQSRFLQTTAEELREAAAGTADGGEQAEQLVHIVDGCCAIRLEEGEAAVPAAAVDLPISELKAAASGLAKGLFAELTAARRWPCAAKREAYIFAELCYAMLSLLPSAPDSSPAGLAAGALAALQATDRAHLVGAPPELVQEFGVALQALAHAEWTAGLASGGLLTDSARAALGALSSRHRSDSPAEEPSVLPSKLSPPRMILRIPGLEAAQFTDSFYRKGRAVIVPGAASGWAAAAKWPDLEWLFRQHGHRVVPVELGVHGRSAWEERVMTLGDFITRHLLGCPAQPPQGRQGAGEARPSREVAYLAQHALFKQIPSLRCDYEAPAHLWELLEHPRLVSCNAWFGTSGTISPLHFDADDNFLVQLAGHKYIRVYGRDQTDKLYVRRAGQQGADGLEDSRNSTYAQGNISGVTDVESVDADAFPLFAKCRRYKECVLGPGDMLFVPAGMWHYVRALHPAAAQGEEHPGFSMSINFFFQTDATGCY